MRVLCAREFQSTLGESVHQLLAEQIVEMGLASIYDVQERVIKCTRTGSEFLFIGLRRNVNNVRSIQNIKRVWVEEAQTVSERSWETLIPSVMRADDAEIWLTWNPELETDATYKRFVTDAKGDPDIWDVEVNWRDNPWFPEGLDRERRKLLDKDPDAYQTVWEGKTRATLDGAVYAREMRELRASDRITDVPMRAGVPVEVFCDLGRRDNTSAWFVQRYALQTRLLYSYQNRGEAWPFYLTKYAELAREKGWLIGNIWLPHDGFNELLGNENTIAAQTRAAGFSVRATPKLSVSTGISAVRTLLSECWFDEVGTQEGRNALARYRYGVDDNGQFTVQPLHDDASDYADAFRYVAVGMQTPKEPVSAKALPKARPKVRGGAGWMG